MTFSLELSRYCKNEDCDYKMTVDNTELKTEAATAETVTETRE
jgi:hypothetical protein